MKPIADGEKISLARCREILNKNGNEYTDEEILMIRNWLYNVAEFTLVFLESKNEGEILEITKLLTNKK